MERPFRIAAIGDLHIRSTVPSSYIRELRGIEQRADILVVTGDITNGGRLMEVELAAELLRPISIPILAVLGNHDRRTTRRRRFMQILSEAGVRLLEGATYVSSDRFRIGFAGVGGSGGGFWPDEGPNTVPVRAFQAMAVRARREAERLDEALSQLDTEVKIVVTHFAPTTSTLEGEPPVKYPLLGNSVLGRVIDKHQVDLVLHGHAHLGRLIGSTPAGVPVRNVAVGVGGGVTIHEVLPVVRMAPGGEAIVRTIVETRV